MYKKLLLGLFFFCWSFALFGQTFLKPKFQDSSTSDIQILKIQFTEEYTIIDFEYNNPPMYEGWICAQSDTYIQDRESKKKYRMLKAKGIPVCPARLDVTIYTKKVRYRLFFAPMKLTRTYTRLNVIEPAPPAENPFNFYNILLQIRA